MGESFNRNKKEKINGKSNPSEEKNFRKQA